MITLACTNASIWPGDADFVFTHPYAPLPKQLRGLPSIINLFIPPGMEQRRRQAAEAWTGARLVPLGEWAEGRNAIYVANLPVRPVEIADLTTDPPGWFPEELPRRLLRAYADLIPEGGVIWDGFMGRGTVGKVALEMGYRFVGLDVRPDRVAMAREYLGV